MLGGFGIAGVQARPASQCVLPGKVGQGAESLALSRGSSAERQAESLMLVHPQLLGEIVERHQ
jgi:hypothetical protein